MCAEDKCDGVTFFSPKHAPQDARASCQNYKSLKINNLKTKNTFQTEEASSKKCFKMSGWLYQNERVTSPILPVFDTRWPVRCSTVARFRLCYPLYDSILLKYGVFQRWRGQKRKGNFGYSSLDLRQKTKKPFYSFNFE